MPTPSAPGLANTLPAGIARRFPAAIDPALPVIDGFEPLDSAAPLVAPTGVAVDETQAASNKANADHTLTPVFDTTASTEQERLSAIAPPLISNGSRRADKDDTSDISVAPHDDATATSGSGPAAAVNAADTPSRPDHAQRTDRNERANEANGLAAPLRTALRERTDRRDDRFEITVRLDPPELGAVRVRVFTQGDNVKISLHAESSEARAALQQRQEDVRALLHNEGFNLDGFDVESNDNRRQPSDQSPRRRSAASPPEFAAPQLEDDGALRL